MDRSGEKPYCMESIIQKTLTVNGIFVPLKSLLHLTFVSFNVVAAASLSLAKQLVKTFSKTGKRNVDRFCPMNPG